MDDLSFFSEPGIYVIETKDGPVYDVDIPEDLNDAAILLISKVAGAADDREGRTLIKVFELSARVGEQAYFLVKEGDVFKEVLSKPVISINRVS